MPLKKKKFQITVIIILVLLLLMIVFLHKQYYQETFKQSPRKKNTEPNRLAVGKLATITGPLKIKINSPVELDFKTKAEILELRKNAVRRFSQLLRKKYEPAESVFGQISDNASWWGIKGQYYYDQGSKSIEGESEESRFILNPFLLVAADFLGLSIWKHGALVWDKKKITEKHLDQPDFPLYCHPEFLQWQPEKAYAEVKYNVTGYLQKVNKWVVKPLNIKHASFDLVAYNAHDMGLNYIYLSLKDSENIIKKNHSENAVLNNQFIHLGGSSKYPGGSNNMSPFIAGISDFDIDKLPATAVVFLWHKKPESVKAPPDMTFVIKFY